MPTRKQEKRRRKLRVHGPSSDAVGAPPTGRKPPREEVARRRARSALAVASRPCPRSGAPLARARSWAIFMVVIVVVTTRGSKARRRRSSRCWRRCPSSAVRALRPLDGPQGLQEGHGARARARRRSAEGEARQDGSTAGRSAAGLQVSGIADLATEIVAPRVCRVRTLAQGSDLARVAMVLRRLDPRSAPETSERDWHAGSESRRKAHVPAGARESRAHRDETVRAPC